MTTYRLTAIVEKDEDGYFALCPKLQGCYTQGDTLDDALANFRDAIRLHLEDMIAKGEALPHVELVTLSTV